jgi:predicted DNA-binding transcriptional regulator AlpA
MSVRSTGLSKSEQRRGTGQPAPDLPPLEPAPDRLVHKGELLERLGVSFPTIWSWMRRGTFPRARVVGGKSCWLSSEIDAWVASLPVRRLKGDAA